ncbi:MAG: agmatinase family protein [Pseudomonadota bacterium]
MTRTTKPEIATPAKALWAALLCGVIALPAYAADDFDPKTEKTIIDLMRENPDSIPLEPRDPNRDVRNFYVDCETIEGRDPGPINIQSTKGGYAQLGIPTFFRTPVAICPQDLVAGEVDIAIMGAPIDLGSAMRGTGYAPALLRVGEPLAFWGDFISNAHPTVGDIDPISVFNVVDYGDAAVDLFSNERSVLSVHQRVTEIVESGAVPFVVGGDHSLMYPDVVAVTDFHGKGEVAVVHFDAHYDGTALAFGHYLTHGGPVRRLIDEGHVKGEHFWQIGLNSAKPSGADLSWMRSNNIKFRYMHEIDLKGWRAVMDEVLAELEASGIEKVYISLDTDVLEPAYAPGMGTPEPGGMTIRELFPMLRGVAAATNIVGLEIVEVNPLTDPTYRSKLVAVRAMREMMTGMAMREQGITDPYYVAPKWESWDSVVEGE